MVLRFLRAYPELAAQVAGAILVAPYLEPANGRAPIPFRLLSKCKRVGESGREGGGGGVRTSLGISDARHRGRPSTSGRAAGNRLGGDRPWPHELPRRGWSLSDTLDL